MNTAAIIEKWYKRIGFDSRYDRAFYNALKTIVIDPAATVYTLDKNQQDGKKNFLSYLYFCEALSAFYAEKGIPENILMDTLSDLPRWLDVWRTLSGKYRVAKSPFQRRTVPAGTSAVLYVAGIRDALSLGH